MTEGVYGDIARWWFSNVGERYARKCRMHGSVGDSGMKVDSDCWRSLFVDMWLFSDTWWMCLSFFNMAGRRSVLQWRKFARQNCLRGRAARYVAAAALWLVAACGCCLALLLPLTMLLGVLAAVLLPSFLRCVQLRYLHGLLRQEALLLEFVQRVPYYCMIIENPVDIAVPWLHVTQWWLGMLIRLQFSECICCKRTVYRSCVGFPLWAMLQWSLETCFCDYSLRVGDDGGTILLFLLESSFSSLRTWGVMWADDCFRTTFGLACRQRLDVSKIHIHVGHDVLQRNFVEDWLDYVVAVSRVVLAPAVFILLSTLPAKEKIRCGEGGYRSCWARAISGRAWADAIAACWSSKLSWKALLAARHCVATQVLLSRRENRSGAIGLSIDICISYHNRYFNIVIFNIRVSIRVRGLHLVFSVSFWGPREISKER